MGGRDNRRLQRTGISVPPIDNLSPDTVVARPLKRSVMCFSIIKRTSNVLLAAVILTCAVASTAQTATGTIDGIITDVMGAVVARAKVTIIIGSMSRSLETNEMGEFRATVPPGISRITVASPGFKVAKLNRVRVTAGATRSLKIVLSVRPVKHGKCPKGQPCIWL